MKVYENLDINDLDGEIWKIIKDFPDYLVSNLGRIKSFKKWNGTNKRILKQYKNKWGYLIVNLYKNKKYNIKYVHIFLYEIFYDDKLKLDECVHHKDENKENNYYDNLEKMTKKEHHIIHNKKRIILDETKNKISKNHADVKGKNNPNFKLTNQKINTIHIDIIKGDMTQRQMAKKHNIARSTISNIKTGKIKYEKM
jgi:predicted XRE-type DNA-binding protein